MVILRLHLNLMKSDLITQLKKNWKDKIKQKNASFNNKNDLDQFCLEAHWGNCAKWSQVGLS